MAKVIRGYKILHKIAVGDEVGYIRWNKDTSKFIGDCPNTEGLCEYCTPATASPQEAEKMLRSKLEEYAKAVYTDCVVITDGDRGYFTNRSAGLRTVLFSFRRVYITPDELAHQSTIPDHATRTTLLDARNWTENGPGNSTTIHATNKILPYSDALWGMLVALSNSFEAAQDALNKQGNVASVLDALLGNPHAWLSIVARATTKGEEHLPAWELLTAILERGSK